MFSNAASTREQISGIVISARSVLDAEGTRVNEQAAVTAIGVEGEEGREREGGKGSEAGREGEADGVRQRGGLGVRQGEGEGEVCLVRKFSGSQPKSVGAPMHRT